MHGRAARVVRRYMGSPETFRRAGLVEAGRSVVGRPNLRWEVDTVPARG
ncbi:MAG TPA: hypothetical protein VFN57_04630 [Thermomicrobiaceae bacterium]|nr:hypothetical protein [Thermomicrobiaceae bacterium]